MAEKVNLNNIKKEIEARKAEKGIIPANLGTATGRFAAPKDEFLHGLIHSINSGQDTPSTNLLREVNDKVMIKDGQKTRARIPNQQTEQAPPQQFRQPQRPINNMAESMDREDKAFADFERARKQTLAESIGELIPGAQQQQQAARYTGQPQMLNENMILENVKNTVNLYLAESLMPILEESTRSTIIEMYAVETIKKTLNENKALIREVVIEVIREINAAQKAKAAQK